MKTNRQAQQEQVYKTMHDNNKTDSEVYCAVFSAAIRAGSPRATATARAMLRAEGIKPKDLMGIPWRLALALQAQGWYLRQDIIWHKPNPMPESVRDRCTKSHEYLFLLTKRPKYYFNNEAIKEPSVDAESYSGKRQRTGGKRKSVGLVAQGLDNRTADYAGKCYPTRNKRSVWCINTSRYRGAHFATFPPALIEPCVLAGSRVGDTVLDPFSGSGTTGEVALKYGRHYIGIDINPHYHKMAQARFARLAQEKALPQIVGVPCASMARGCNIN